VTVSQYVAGLAHDHGVEWSKIAVVPNSIEVSDSSGSTDATRKTTGPLRIGQIGRMDPGKGFPDAVRAFAAVRREFPSAELVLVGDGRERPLVEQTVTDLALEGSVQLTGWQPDPQRWLRTFDIFIHPSRQEPFGLAVLEAAAAGLPIVGYAEGGVNEIVVNGETGLLVTPGDVPALTAALGELCGDEALRARLGRAGRDRAATSFRPDEAGRLFSDVLRRSSAIKAGGPR
jgi:glycosyltransferase involved in cell wall biosynthesis